MPNATANVKAGAAAENAVPDAMSQSPPRPRRQVRVATPPLAVAARLHAEALEAADVVGVESGGLGPCAGWSQPDTIREGPIVGSASATAAMQRRSIPSMGGRRVARRAERACAIGRYS
jgi:hypothetical protein